jgi:glutamate-1-semialdehyde 2,1-aminomutase
MDLIAPLGSVYQAGTLSGNPIAICAGLETLAHIEQVGFYKELERKTRLLTDPIEDYLKQHHIPALLKRVGSMFTLFFGITAVKQREDLSDLDRAKFKSFFRYLFERGVYIPPSAYEAWFVSSAHTDEHLEYTRGLILDFLSESI